MRFGRHTAIPRRDCTTEHRLCFGRAQSGSAIPETWTPTGLPGEKGHPL